MFLYINFDFPNRFVQISFHITIKREANSTGPESIPDTLQAGSTFRL